MFSVIMLVVQVGLTTFTIPYSCKCKINLNHKNPLKLENNGTERFVN